MRKRELNIQKVCLKLHYMLSFGSTFQKISLWIKITQLIRAG